MRHRSTSGSCPDRRRGARQRWVRPFHRVTLSMNASQRLIESTLRAVAAAERTFRRRPLQASRTLHDASGVLLSASRRLIRAAEHIAELTACVEREPETTQQVPQLVDFASTNYVVMASRLTATLRDLFDLHDSVVEGLETGTLVPEPPADRRPRIVLAPRPVPVRAFLRLRQPRVRERIAPLLRRRRRTLRPASLRVPRQSVLGRAPPLS